MDAVLATIVDGGQAILVITMRSIEKKCLSFILSVTTVFFSAAASANPLAGSPARWIVRIHQIHAAGRVNSSATMVRVFIALFVVCGWFHDITSSSYVENVVVMNLKDGVNSVTY
jgi:hypothetical protein